VLKPIEAVAAKAGAASRASEAKSTRFKHNPFFKSSFAFGMAISLCLQHESNQPATQQERNEGLYELDF
jgi:hypothetical protein